MKNTKSQIEAARIQFKAGRLDEALALFEQVLKENPEATAAYIGIGTIHMKQKDYGEAENYFNGALHVTKKPGPALAWLAAAVEKQGDDERAIKLNLDALQCDPSSLRARMSISRIYVRRQQFEEAREHLCEALRYNPQASAAGVMLAKIAQRQGNSEEAIEKVEQVLVAQQPGPRNAFLLKAKLLLRTGQASAAAETFAACLEKDAKDARIHMLYGQALRQCGDERAAQRALKQAIAIEPHLPHAQLELARSLFYTRDFNEARVILSQMSFAGRELASVHFLLGEIYRAQGYYRQAIDEYEAGLLHTDEGLRNQTDVAAIRQKDCSEESKVDAYHQFLEHMAFSQTPREDMPASHSKRRTVRNSMPRRS